MLVGHDFHRFVVHSKSILSNSEPSFIVASLLMQGCLFVSIFPWLSVNLFLSLRRTCVPRLCVFEKKKNISTIIHISMDSCLTKHRRKECLQFNHELQKELRKSILSQVEFGSFRVLILLFCLCFLLVFGSLFLALEFLF